MIIQETKRTIFKKNADSLPPQTGYASINISTYCDSDGKIVQLNRFDLKGKPHENIFDSFDGEQKQLLQKYYSEKANAPHFHFYSEKHTQGLDNAIGLNELIVYLKDLKKENDEKLLKYSLDMPFLSILKENIEYKQTFKKSLK